MEGWLIAVICLSVIFNLALKLLGFTLIRKYRHRCAERTTLGIALTLDWMILGVLYYWILINIPDADRIRAATLRRWKARRAFRQQSSNQRRGVKAPILNKES